MTAAETLRERVVKVVKVVIQWYHSATAAAAVVNLLVQANTLLYFTFAGPSFSSFLTLSFTQSLIDSEMLLPLPQ